MELNKYESIKNLNSSTYNWQTRVRLQSFWKGINRQRQEYYGINMIFIDDSNSRIHGFASKKYFEDLFEKLVVDMVGKVENLQEIIRTTKNNQETIRLKFDLSDGRFRVKVIFFDAFAIEIEEAFKKMDVRDIFVIISCAKVGRYKGAPNLTNYPATRVFINPNHYSLVELKEKSSLHHLQLGLHHRFVMVRVQGPDPKGLKMRRHAFHHYNSGKTTLSVSGMLVPSSLFDPAIAKQILGDIDASLTGSAFVLTVPSVIEPFLSNRDNLAHVCELFSGVVPYTDLRAEAHAHTVLEMNYTEQQLTAAVASEGLRPVLAGHESGVPQRILSMIERCWDTNPQNRPSFDEIVIVLDSILAKNVSKVLEEEKIPPVTSLISPAPETTILRPYQESVNWFSQVRTETARNCRNTQVPGWIVNKPHHINFSIKKTFKLVKELGGQWMCKSQKSNPRKEFDVVTVKKLDEKSKWYYAQCIDCEIEIIRDKGIYSCTKCPRIFPYPEKRFRLCTICSDQTGSMVVIFPNSEVTRFIDKTVVDIHFDCLKEEDEENFPEILRTFVNQKYTITLQITQDNLNKGSTVYEAKEIMESHDITDTFDPHEKIKMEIQDDSQLKDLEEEYINNETPQTGNSSNTKKRARTNVQPVLFDANDDVELKGLKNIKKEKKNRIHAFIPGLCFEKLEEKITVGNVHNIKNFIVQPYKPTDIYRCLRNDKQLIFSRDTEVEDLEDNGTTIPIIFFDFVDHNEINSLSNQKTYLAVRGRYRYHPTEFIERIHVCKHCPRTVPHPEKRYTINVVAYDATGTMDIILGDREVRTLLGKRARDIINEAMSPGARNSRIYALENMLSTTLKTLVSMASELSEAEE
ncbi:hypothetical protein POM88_027731 [Heracleum sosnowskyi]|uniref:Replication factor A C-terminal domain-containing protein n=1 Tax=Heracleum sosnowskyi TaxID=360622 RepID=A0AAD8MQ76_9APIA|nr:hypothetical protein POM88_027731 [Heracleum sosnowskyi]